MPPPPSRSPDALADEMVEEFLLRIPPDEPKSLLRAALVCKRWRRIVSDPGFGRRFRELHRAPPMLGFLYNRDLFSVFVPTCSFRPPSAARLHGAVIDARHGRVLLHPGLLDWEKDPLDNAFFIWDPMTDERKELPLLPESVRPADWNAAILCAAAPTGSCDHLDCCGGPFLVVFVSMDRDGMFAYTYSPESGAWILQTSNQHPCCSIPLLPSAFVGNALYFFAWDRKAVLKYDLGTRESSVIQMPLSDYYGSIVLMTTEHGGLGFAAVVNSELHLWSREAGSEEDAGWVQSRVIELKTLFPADILSASLCIVGFVEGIDIVFVRTNCELYTVDLKSMQVTKVQKDIDICLSHIFPYRSFYTPALGTASTCEEWQVLDQHDLHDQRFLSHRELLVV